MRERKKQVEWNTPHQKAKIESKKKKSRTKREEKKLQTETQNIYSLKKFKKN